MSARKSQEEQLRERINKRGNTRAKLIGVDSQTEKDSANEEQNINQNVSQNINNVGNENVEPIHESTPKASTRKRKPRSKKDLEKEKFINKYQPRTFYVRPELLKKFDKYSGGLKGEKTRMINEALEEYLDTFEDE